jgi:hypothetical protein
MKKQDLKKIIKEQVKNLMKEQSFNFMDNVRSFTYCGPLPVDGSYDPNFHWDGTNCVINGQNYGQGMQTNGHMALIAPGSDCSNGYGSPSCTLTLPAVGVTWCLYSGAQGLNNPGGQCPTGIGNKGMSVITGNVQPPSTSNGSIKWESAVPYNPQNTQTSGCPGCNSGQHTWNNQSNWENNFNMNMQNANWFNAPNQPCQFLQNRITHWMGIQQGISNCQTSVQYNNLSCKIKYVQTTLQPQYNC